MMSGLLPHHSGGLGFTPILEGTATLVTELRTHGYFTVGIHKLEHMQPASCFPWDMADEGGASSAGGRSPAVYAEGVRKGIEAAQMAGKPFFINCNINDPHRPFYGSVEAKIPDHSEEGVFRVPHEIGPEDVDVPPFLEDLPQIRQELAQYANSCQRASMSIAKVLEVLAASSEASNTVIFFSADHGMPFPFSKATVYTSGSRTPALLHYPGMEPCRTFSEGIQNIDYLPTLLDVIGLPHPIGLDGTSLLPLIRQGSGAFKRPYQITYINSISSGADYPQRCIQDNQFSLIFMPWADGKKKFQIESMQGLTYNALKLASRDDERLRKRLNQFDYGVLLGFYDLKADPGERVNLIDSTTHQRVIKKMQMLLLKSMEVTSDPQFDAFSAVMRKRELVSANDS
jgi:N-sulfoglucosamine sulfohydrolase